MSRSKKDRLLKNNDGMEVTCSILDALDGRIEALHNELRDFRAFLGVHARDIHQNYSIYYLYACLDSISLSYSQIKCFFDLLVPANNVGFMHQMMLMPGGIVAIVIGSTFLIAYSVLAAIFEKKNPEKLTYTLVNLPPESEDNYYALLEGKNGFVQHNGELYFVDQKKKTRERLVQESIEKDKLEQLKQLFSDDMKKCILVENARDLALLAELDNSSQDIDDVKRIIATGWIYMREALQALKYSYKGVRNIYGFIAKNKPNSFLLTYITLPISGLVIINRLLLRYLREERKSMKQINQNVLKAIAELYRELEEGKIKDAFFDNQLIKLRATIQKQSALQEALAFPMVIFNGAMDGTYLYFGFFALAPLGAALFPLLAVCALYTALAIISRLYEEYLYQQDLEITAIQAELALSNKELFRLYQQILALNNESDNDDINKKAKQELIKKYEATLERFQSSREKLEALVAAPFWGIIIMGIKHGLALNGAINSAVALIVAIMSLASTAFPPAALIVILSLGFLWLGIGIFYACLEHRHHQLTQANEGFEKTSVVMQALREVNYDARNTSEVLKDYQQSLDKASTYTPFPPSKLYSYFEVLRCFFSGLSKGQKTADYGLNPLQEADGNGHYTDAPWMLVVASLLGLGTAIVLATRAVAKEFKDTPPPAEKEQLKKIKTISHDSRTFFYQKQNQDNPNLASMCAQIIV